MSEPIEAWIGRERRQTSVVDPELLRRYAAALGASLEVEANFPPLGHWAIFCDVVGPEAIGADGHPRRGLFLPDVDLPRRMFASAEFRFEQPLTLGVAAEFTTTITDVRRRSGRASGEMVLVDVQRRLVQGDVLSLEERQTILYRAAGDPTAPVVAKALEAEGETWNPSRVDLFRFSAATYNSHRIHYDLPYARDEEGYPDLVVHGPFTAAKLCGQAERLSKGPLKSFSFRAQSPLFVGQPIQLKAGEKAGSIAAIRCDGEVAMSAEFT
jgi:3-methylfumaryl-CoA hydratase